MINDDFLKGKPSITYIVTFGNKDRDIWKWAASVPKGKFSQIIKDMLRAYYNYDDNYILPHYNDEIEVQSPFRKSFGIGKSDYDVYEIISQFEDQLISFQIKEVIRHYLNKSNYASNTSSCHETIKNDTIDTNIESTKSRRKVRQARKTKNKKFKKRRHLKIILYTVYVQSSHDRF